MHIAGQAWKIIQTEVFQEWYESLDAPAREAVYEKILVLRRLGPRLGRPYADTLKRSKYANMKELRVQNKGRPYRILFAFTPDRTGILLIGGNKAGNKGFYDEVIPLAEVLYEQYLKDMKATRAKKTTTGVKT